MPASLALGIWLILLLALLRFDPAREPKTSWAVWVPVIWIFIVGSRLPSQWLGEEVHFEAQAFVEGNPLDRTVFTVLILLAIAILVSRSFKWGDFVARNLALMALLLFALASVLWSDYTFVAFKRWFRDLGNYVVILVALSDPRPLEAIRAVFRRLAYLLIPLSILLVKYYPEIGRQYASWTGAASNVGAATSKNMLGAACLVSGVFFFWDTVSRWSERKESRTRRIILVNFAFMAMTLWLLYIAESATSTVCLALGCLVVAAAHTRTFQRSPRFLMAMVPTSFVLYLILAFGLGLNGVFAGAVGRNPTLTDRTQIWAILLSIHTNPVLGTGYESFWLGSRLAEVWRTFRINEAHNGYLQVYLNLGLIGLCLLLAFLMASYRNVGRRLRPFTSLGSFSLAFWTILLFYNMTEAAFPGGLLWLAFLPGAIALAPRAEDRPPSASVPSEPDLVEAIPVSVWELDA
ncbi:MAG: O-antigen ligase family protein [Terriglobia bacterium]